MFRDYNIFSEINDGRGASSVFDKYVSISPILSTTTTTLSNTTITISSTLINIDCSLGNFFVCNSNVNNNDVVFTNVPNYEEIVYKATLFFSGNISKNNFPSNVKWSIYSNLSSGGPTPTHAVAFSTYDNGSNWLADDVRFI